MIAASGLEFQQPLFFTQGKTKGNKWKTPTKKTRASHPYTEIHIQSRTHLHPYPCTCAHQERSWSMAVESTATGTTLTQADRRLHTNSGSGSGRLAQHSISLHLTPASNLDSIAATCVRAWVARHSETWIPKPANKIKVDKAAICNRTNMKRNHLHQTLVQN